MAGKQVALKDAFISYSSADQKAITMIAAKLEENKISVFLAPSDIHPGDPFISRIEEGLQNSQVVTLFLTKASLESYWVKEEWQIRMVQMSQDKTLGLILILLPGIEDKDVPTALLPKHRLDFRKRDLTSSDDIEEIASEITKALRKDMLPRPGDTTIGVPFVVFAMTENEAKDLVSGEAFKNDWTTQADRNLYKSLISAVEYDEADLPSYYGKTRDEWRPPLANPAHPPSHVTIRDNIESITKLINSTHRSTPNDPTVRPKFFSTDFLTADADWRDRTWAQLTDQGGVLIVDVFSLCHPELRKNLADSGLSVLDTFSLVVLSPLRGDNPPAINGIIELDISQRLKRAFYRYNCNLDLFCEFGVGNVRALNRWLYWALPETIKIVQGQKVSPLRRNSLSTLQGKSPRGFESLF